MLTDEYIKRMKTIKTDLDVAREGQKKKHSLIEVILNVTIGYVIAILTQMAVFSLFGIQVAFHNQLAIGGIFTAVSIVRSYYVRRLFNWFHVKGIL